MAVKKYRFPVCVGVHDPAQDQAEVRDPHTGQLFRAYSTGLKHVPPGTEVEVEEELAERTFALHGTYENYLATQGIIEAAASAKTTGRKVVA